MAGQTSNARAGSDGAKLVEDQRGSVDGAVVAHLRARYHLICRRIPLKRRRLVWARALYSCDIGPKHESGPFAGERQGGCGWHRYVYVGVGVGKPAMPNVPAVPLPSVAGECERCGGPLSYDNSQALLWLPDGWPEGEVDASGRGPIVRALVPGKRVAGKMAHAGQFYAQLHEADADADADADAVTNPGER
jgi:hypothetical protein